MGNSLFVPCPGCCDCPFFTDSFDRPDSSDLGINWQEVEKDSAIQTLGPSNTKVLMVPGDGIVLCRQRPWKSEVSQWLEVTIVNRQPGDINYILLGYCDRDNYYWVKVQRDPLGGNGTATMGVRENGTDRTLYKPPPEGDEEAIYIFDDDERVALRTCIYPDQVFLVMDPSGSTHVTRADISGVAAFPWATSPAPKVGLASGPGNSSYFDDFYATPTKFTNRRCFLCCCACDEGTLPLMALPPTLTLVIEAHDEAGGLCTAPSAMAPWLNGKSCYLDSWPGLPCVYYRNEGEPRRPPANALPYNPGDPDPYCPFSAMDGLGALSFTFHCGGPENFRLELQGVSPEGGWEPNEGSSCGHWEFGPYDFGCCGFSGIGNYGHIMVTFTVTA